MARHGAVAVAVATKLGVLVALAVAIPSTAAAQDNFHSPRHHAVPPLSQIIPSLRAPMVRLAQGKESPEAMAANGDGSYTHDAEAWSAHVDADGRVHLSDKPSIQGQLLLVPPLIVFAGTFDATDMVMRWLGEDPYQYQKLQFMNRTFERRATMRKLHTERQMETALVWLPTYLRAVWSHKRWTPALRRRVLFALWDECAERGNAHTRDGGKRARRVIERFVQDRLPPGSPHGYTAHELRSLNQARTSLASFTPYRSRGPLDDTAVARIATLASLF